MPLFFLTEGKKGGGGVVREERETASWWEKDLMLHTSSLCGTVLASFSPQGQKFFPR